MNQPILHETINGREVDITVHADGIFHCTCDAEVYEAETLSKLKAKLKEAIGRKINIPATLLNSDWRHRTESLRLEDIIITGMVDGRSRITYRDAKGKADSTYLNGEAILKRLSADEKTQLQSLYTARAKAQEAWDVAVKQSNLDVRAAVSTAAYLGEAPESKRRKA